jgi:mannosyltransferase
VKRYLRIGTLRERLPDPLVGLVVVGSMALLAVLARYSIARRPFWLDEATSILFARKPLLDLVGSVADSNTNMTAYYFVLHFWRQLGDTEMPIRALSALCAVLTVPALYLMGRRLLDRRAALLACVLFATNAMVIAYAQEARSYTLLLLLLSWGTVAYLRALDRQSVGAWLLVALPMAAALYCHYFAAFVLMSHGAGFVVRRAKLRPALPALAVLIAAAGSIGFFVLGRGGSPLDWIPSPTLESVWETVRLVGGGTDLRALASIALIVLGVFSAARWSSGLLLGWVVLPFVGILLISLVQPAFVSRYLFMTVPAISLLVGAGISRLRLRPAILLTAVALCLAAVPALTSVYTSRYDDWRSAAAYVAEQAEPGDYIIYNDPSGAKPFQLQLERYDHARLVTINGLEPTSVPRLWMVFWRTGYQGSIEFRNGFGDYEPLVRKSYGGVTVELDVLRGVAPP